MKKMIFLLVFISHALFAQDVDKQFIIRSGQYYYGTGVSQDENEARDRALSELTSQIAVHVASSFRRVVTETGEKFNDSVESILNTHAAATLRNVHTIKRPASGGMIEVFCYLKKSEVEKIFNVKTKLKELLS